MVTSLCLLYILYVFYFTFHFYECCLWLWLISFQIILVFFIPIHYIFKMFFIFGCTGLFVTYGRQGLLSTCSARASHSNAFSCYRVWALCLCTVVVTPELWKTELWPTGFVAPRNNECVGPDLHIDFPMWELPGWGMEPLCPVLITRWILYLWARREAPKLVPWHVSWNQWTE